MAMNIEQATAFLYSLKPRGIRFGLENTRYVLEKLGTPDNLVKVEAFHYDWGEGRDNRWRVNVVVEEMLQTDLGNLIPTWKRHDCFFLRFDDESQSATYCNPPIEKKYNSEGELIDGSV